MPTWCPIALALLLSACGDNISQPDSAIPADAQHQDAALDAPADADLTDAPPDACLATSFCESVETHCYYHVIVPPNACVIFQCNGINYTVC